MSMYNHQHEEAIGMVRERLAGFSDARLRDLKDRIGPYLEFRGEVSRFQEENFAGICSKKCFADRTSACCGREGILVFFADFVINALVSTDWEIEPVAAALARDRGGFNCVYLNEAGCLWRLKPVACAMFLCEHAGEEVFDGNDSLGGRWEELRRRELLFTRPTRPVLFDDLERFFIKAGCESPLMYLHHSPGLLRLKAKHGLL